MATTGSKTKTTWVLVAERGSARLFALDSENELLELKTLTNTEGTVRKSSVVSDRQGYFKGREGSLQTGDAQTDYPHKAAEEFARTVTAELEAGRTSNEFEHLIIFSAPLFLGMLRKKMSAPLAALVTEEVDKDLAGSSVDEIRDRLVQLQS